MNQVFVSGRLSRDVEYSTTSNGEVARFGMAVNEQVPSGDGTYTDKVHWVDCRAFKNAARQLRQLQAAKGSLVVVSGKLDYSERTTPEGQKRSALRVVAFEIQGIKPFQKLNQQQSRQVQQSEGDDESERTEMLEEVFAGKEIPF